jgi:hypothetical protein
MLPPPTCIVWPSPQAHGAPPLCTVRDGLSPPRRWTRAAQRCWPATCTTRSWCVHAAAQCPVAVAVASPRAHVHAAWECVCVCGCFCVYAAVSVCMRLFLCVCGCFCVYVACVWHMCAMCVACVCMCDFSADQSSSGRIGSVLVECLLYWSVNGWCEYEYPRGLQPRPHDPLHASPWVGADSGVISLLGSYASPAARNVPVLHPRVVC